MIRTWSFWGRRIAISDDAGDTIVGSDRSDIIFGRGGDDVIVGGAGSDYLFGGAGNDRISGGRGSDFVSGDAGDDVLVGYAAAWAAIDRINGDGLREVGFSVAETGPADNGADTLTGGAGADVLIGGYGADTLLGGDGDDTLIGYNATFEQYQIYDAEGQIVGGGGGIGRSGAMDRSNDTLSGGRGNDFIAGGGGNDELSGDEGNDTLIGDEGRDVLRGGAGDDELHGDELASSVIGDNDVLFGGAGADRFVFGGLGEAGVTPVFGDDVIRDFSRAEGDLIDLRAFASLTYADLVITRSNNLDIDGDGIGDRRAGVIITSADFAPGDSISVVGVTGLTAASFLFADVIVGS